MFTNSSQIAANTAALGVHAVLFASSRAAGFDGVADEEALSFFADSSAMSVDTSVPDFTVGLSRFERAWLLTGPPPLPPGGGARRPGAPGAPAGGSGNGGGRGPKNNITVDDVLVTLHQLEMKREKVSLTPEELAFLQKEGLIEQMSDADYSKHERSVLRVDFLNNDLKAAREEQGSLSKSRSVLLQTHYSRWHRIFTGGKKLVEEEAELKRSANRLKEIGESIDRIEEELRNLKITKEYLATFVHTTYGYMRLSRKGGQLLESIKNRNRE